MALYKSDAEGNPEGDAIVDGGAFDNEGAIVRPDLEPGDYIVRFSALLSVAATYDADATLKAGTDPLAGPKGPAKPTRAAPTGTSAPAQSGATPTSRRRTARRSTPTSSARRASRPTSRRR